MKYIASLLISFLNVSAFAQFDAKISGMTLVAPRDSFSSNPMTDLKEINCKWVAVVPYSFTPENQAKVHFGNHHQWWGETPRGAEATIRMAKQNGLKVMLKPQLWMHGSWVGALDFETEEDWLDWESEYRDYILTFAKIAQKTQAELFCVGTEFKISVQKREKFWRVLIAEVRAIYDGKLTYCSNWDEFDEIPFWDAVDFIGVSAYFPLCETDTPTLAELKSKWKPIVKRLKALHKLTNKKILFTEYGYLSVDGCAGKTWELEKKRRDLSTNQMAQSNALEALYASFCDEEFWAGGFLWKWYPHQGRRSGHRDNDYTPQGKISEKTIAKWYGEFNAN
jgi:hypothetical protein